VTEVEALKAELAALRELVASVVPPPAPEPVAPLEPIPWMYVPPPTKALAVIASGPELRHLNVRQVRQLATAVALCRGATLVGSEVPVEYEPLMKRLAASLAAGLSWRDALSACGLTPPDDDDILHRAQALRDGLHGVWDETTDFLGRLEYRLPNWTMKDMLKKIRPYL
jgi:hypothetical protein